MISIHMTTYRRFRSGLLARAVESTLEQDFDDFEFVICDDASSDGTEAYLADIATQDARVRVFRNERNINSNAISLGRCLQQSDMVHPWIGWMFDDCELLPGALTALSDRASQGDVEMVYGITEVPRPDGTVRLVGAASEADTRTAVRTSTTVAPNGGSLIRREVFERVGWYDSNVILRRSCDWDLMRRIIGAGVSFVPLPVVLLREFGELQVDLLRNAFTTTVDIVSRYVAARDACGVRLDLASVLLQPMDWIPPGTWTAAELDLMRAMFLEYFLSVADGPRAFRWAGLLSESLPDGLARDNLLQAATKGSRPEIRAMAAGAFAALVLVAYKERRELRAVEGAARGPDSEGGSHGLSI